jgi:DNA-binding NarL/FixJ family response regulator
MRLGLMGEQPHSIDEIAKQLGYKEKTVDEIIASVLRKTKDNPDSIKELGADEVLGRMEYGRRIRVINREHFLPKRENDEK